ncbi:MAG: hypothetical protein MUE97_05785, partial [Phycisphaerales bacterium]|nr:hypothetical protein [Phycisphaerales bacterium]
SGAADTQLARQRLLRQLSRGVKVCGYVLLLLLAASAITFFGLHAWLTSMADQARADRTGSNAVDVRLRGVIITSSGSAPGTIDPAGWDALMHLASETTKAEARVKRPNVVGQTLQYLDLDVVRGGRPLRNMLTPMGNSTPADEDAEQLLRIKELVSDASAGPLHDAGLALLAAPLGVRPLPEPSEAPAAWGLWMPIPGLTLAARLQLARMEFALPASPHARYAATLQGEQATYLQSVAITLALARQLGAQWTLVDRSTASAIESDLLTSLQRHIESLPEPWLVELHNLLARQPEPAPVERVLEGDTIIMNDLLAWLFEDRLKAREMLRRGDDRVVYNGVTSRARTTPWQWLGSYAANRESLAAYRQAQLDKAIASKSTPFPKQLVLGRAIDLPPMATAMVRFRSDSIVLQDVSLRLRRQALGVMIAIERYQRRTGTYPPALSQLTFADGAFNTLDPISGTPFRYRLTNPDDPLWTTLTAGTNDHPKPYALWSVGPDGIDQLGTEAWLRNPRLTTIVSPADFIHMLYNESHDILLNDTSWGDNRQQLR